MGMQSIPTPCSFVFLIFYLVTEMLGQHSWRDEIVPGFDSLTFPFQVMQMRVILRYKRSPRA